MTIPEDFWTLGNILTLVFSGGILITLVQIGRKLQALDHVVAAVDRMKANIKVITDFLLQSELPFDPEKLQAYSPVQLTDNGKEYLASTGFTGIFEAHREDFLNCISAEDPQSDFDIENAATKAVIQLFNEDYFSPVKDRFYQNPKENRHGFFKIAGVHVRDQYMEYMRLQAGR